MTIARDGALEPATATRSSWRPAAGLLGADAAFPALHGPFGEDGSVQGLLEWLDVPYVGSDVLASAICMDKLTLKRLFAQARSAPGRLRRGRRGGLARALRGDGPAALGEALAARLERRHQQGRATSEELDAAVELAPRHDPRVIVEAHAGGREVECSLLGNERLEASLPGEVVAHAEWYDYETKYGEGGMELVVPAPIPDERRRPRARARRRRPSRSAGCSGLARCDFFVEPDGEVLVNEINTMPGFTETSVYAKLWEATGLAYPDLCDRLVAARPRAPRQSPLARVLARGTQRSMSLISTW